MTTNDFAERACALVGTRFRAQGRGEHGLDCVGVALAAFSIDPATIRSDYALRGNCLNDLQSALRPHFRKVSKTQLRSGDLMLMVAGEQQLHLGIRTGRGFVHAHAGIRRVVETPGLPDWPLVAVYRKRGRR
jgi:hypothetical protein